MAQNTILFVDDEQKILSSLRRLFQPEPYKILLAGGGQQALDLIDGGEHPHMIVSDQRMPGMNGAAFLEQAQQRLPDTVRIMLTGYSDINAAIDAVNKGGIFRYITKPWNDEDLLLVVKAAFEHYTLVQQNKQLTTELQEKNQALEEFNTALETKVEERTRALKKAYEKNLKLTDQLQKKLKELEAKDRIQQYLLTIHELEETLQIVLEVIVDVIEVDRAVIHLVDETDGTLRPAAGVENDGTEGHVPEHKLKDLQDRPVYKKVLDRMLEQGAPVRVKAQHIAVQGKAFEVPPFAVVPILKGEERLGAIEVDRHLSGRPIEATETETILSFCVQAAIAISDSQMRAEIADWEVDLEDVLDEFRG
jgi:FixJ family two-component response regulator